MELEPTMIRIFLCIRENAFRQLMVSQAVYLDRLRIIAWDRRWI